MNYYLQYDEATGQIIGCYPEGRTDIAPPNIKVSETNYKKFHSNQSKYEIRNGKFAEVVIDATIALENYREFCRTEVSRLADEYHNQISQASPQKLARYTDKAQIAQAYKTAKAIIESEDITKSEKAEAEARKADYIVLLQPEATIRNLSIDAHVTAILNANNAFKSAASVIEAIEAKGKLAIQAAKSIEELETIKAKIPTEAQMAFATWQESIGAV